MVPVYAAYTLFGVSLLRSDASSTRYGFDGRIQGLIFVITGVPALVLFVLAPFIPKRPWGWAYGLTLIGIGLSSPCTWPLTIPLIRRWFTPSIKGYFRKR